ncbi:MAG: MFS transporter [Deinococcota bacterium]
MTTTTEFIQKNLRWNFSVNLWDIAFISLSLNLVSRETVMPVLVSELTDSKLAVGLIPAIYTLGFYLPQLLSANFTERLRYKKPITMHLGGWGERLPYGLIALVLFFLGTAFPGLTLICFFVLLGVTSTMTGLATPPWYDMIAKVIPANKRGIWSGIGHGLGAVMGILGAYVVGRVLATHVFPNNFALLFAWSFIFSVISFVGLALNREPPSEQLKPSTPLRRYIQKLPSVLQQHHNYRRFIISRSIMLLGTMSAGSYMIYGTENFTQSGADVASLTALLTAVLIASQAISNLIWGVIGDKRGHKTVLVIAAFVLASSALSTYLAQSPTWLIITFVCLGAYLAAEQVSALNIILEFCRDEDRPTFIGLSNTLLAPLFAFAPVLGGWLVTTFGFQVLFICALLSAISGALLLSFWVEEPRKGGVATYEL